MLVNLRSVTIQTLLEVIGKELEDRNNTITRPLSGIIADVQSLQEPLHLLESDSSVGGIIIYLRNKVLTSLCRNLIFDLCGCQACTSSSISALERRNLLLNLLDSSNLIILAKSYLVGRNLAIFFLDRKLIDGNDSTDSKVSILKLHQVAGL